MCANYTQREKHQLAWIVSHSIRIQSTELSTAFVERSESPFQRLFT
jgi:hypothetical protein